MKGIIMFATNSFSKVPAIAAGLTALLIGCFTINPAVYAVTPAPDGGYPGGNTAEGLQALQESDYRHSSTRLLAFKRSFTTRPLDRLIPAKDFVPFSVIRLAASTSRLALIHCITSTTGQRDVADRLRCALPYHNRLGQRGYRIHCPL